MKRVLVIEDDKDFGQEVIEMLTFEGYDISLALNGIEGLRKARITHPHLILCDIMMPDMDGFEVLKELQKTNPDAILIFITALSDRNNFRFGMELGADDYLTKPFTRNELLSAICARFHRIEKSEIIIKEKTLKSEHAKRKLSEKRKDYGIPTDKRNQFIAQAQGIENPDAGISETIKIVETNNIVSSIKNKIYSELETGCTSEQKKFLNKIKNRIISPNFLWDNLTVFQLQFTKRFPGLIAKIEENHSNLTRYERIFIMATYMELDTNQIAALLSVTSSSVRKSRYRLKKKLKLKDVDDFYNYIRSFISECSFSESGA